MTGWDLPRIQPYPDDSVQCDDCGGYGESCTTCHNRGWLTPQDHPRGRKCERHECSKPLPPHHLAVYCSNECAFIDAGLQVER